LFEQVITIYEKSNLVQFILTFIHKQTLMDEIKPKPHHWHMLKKCCRSPSRETSDSTEICYWSRRLRHEDDPNFENEDELAFISKTKSKKARNKKEKWIFNIKINSKV